MKFCKLWKNETHSRPTLPLHEAIGESVQLSILFVIGALFFLGYVGVVIGTRRYQGPASLTSLLTLLVSSALMVITQLLNNLKDAHLLTIQDDVGCRLWGFSQKFPYYLSLLLTTASFHEMAYGNRMAENSKNAKLKMKIQFMVWSTSFVLSLPAFYIHRINEEGMHLLSPCQKVLLLDSRWAHNLYEGLFAFTSLVPSIYMGLVLHKINFKLKFLYLCKQIPSGLEKKIQQVRAAFFNLVFLVVFCNIQMFIKLVMKTFGFVTLRNECYQYDNLRMSWTTFLFNNLYVLLVVGLYPFFFIHSCHQLTLLDQLCRSGKLVIEYIAICGIGRRVMENTDSCEETMIAAARSDPRF